MKREINPLDLAEDFLAAGGGSCLLGFVRGGVNCSGFVKTQTEIDT